MDWRDYYLREVRPRLDLPLAEAYPLASLVPRDGLSPLGERALLMLVALTGTGKSTTLTRLRGAFGENVMPSRRELADWVAIPMAQALAGEPIAPIRDRARRFAYTKRFAQHVPGGMAAVFSWLNLSSEFEGALLTEGIRGPEEIGHALEHFPRWRIVELTLDPLTRLRRLSRRIDAFDRVEAVEDLSFLPRRCWREAAALVEAGEITPKALAIVRAEAANYGFSPFPDGERYASYSRLDIDGWRPAEVAEAVARLAQEATCPR